MLKKILLFLALLIVIACAIVYYLLQSGEFKPLIKDQIEQALGRRVEVGDVSVSFYPWLGLSADKVEVYNTKEFNSNTKFAGVDSLNIRVKLLPLLGRNFQFDKILINKLEARLVSRGDGTNNWSFPKNEDTGTSESDSPVGEISLKGIEVKDSKLVFDDGKNLIKVYDIQVATGSILPDTSIPVSLGFKFQASEERPMNLYLKGDIIHSQKAISVNNLSSTIDDWLNIKSNLMIDTESSKARLKDTVLSAQGLKAEASVDIDFSDKLSVNGSVAINELNLRQLLANLGSDIKTTNPKVLSNIQGKLNINVIGNDVIVKSENIKVDKTTLSLDGKVTAGKYQANIMGDSIVLDDYMPPDKQGDSKEILPVKMLQGIGIEPSKIKFSKIKYMEIDLDNVNLKVVSRNENINISPISANVFGGKYTGSVGLNILGEKPMISANEKVSNADIKKLLKFLLGNEFIVRKIWISGRGNANVNVRTSGNQIDTLTYNLNGRMNLSVKQGVIHGVNLTKELKKAVTLYEKKVTAPSDAMSDAENKTPILKLEIPTTVKQGVLRSNNIKMVTPELSLDGGGYADLNNQTLNYKLQLEVIHKDELRDSSLKDTAGYKIPLNIGGSFEEPRINIDFEAIAKAKLERESNRKLKQEKQKIKKRLEDEKVKAREKLEERVKKDLGDDLQNRLKDLF